MVSQRRHLFLGLGLAVALALAVSPASASAVSTLTGESFSGISSPGNPGACPSPTFSVSGTATGPYPGTFAESGSFAPGPSSFSATFTTASATTTISGSKAVGAGLSSSCGIFASIAQGPVPYTATIHTSNGNFQDEGGSVVTVVIEPLFASLSENFTSSLTAPVLIAPTSKDQCKNGGWQAFPQFQNQGQCVSFVERQPQA